MLVVVHTEFEALLLQRVATPVFWQSITGSLEWGEAPDVAAARELFEETGIQAGGMRATGIARSFDIFESARHLYAPDVIRNREYLYYLQVESRREISLSEEEHQAYLWVPIHEAVDRVLSWTNALALRAIIQDRST